MSGNPFEILSKKTKIQSNDLLRAVEDDTENSSKTLIEEIFFVTVERDCNAIKLSSHRPGYLYFIGEAFDNQSFNITNIENIIFERLFLVVDKHNVLEFESGYHINLDFVIDRNPINYLFNCYLRIIKIINKSTKYSKSDMQISMNAIFNQARLYVQNSLEITPKEVGIHLYDCISNNSYETECHNFFNELMKLANPNLDSADSLIYFKEFFQHFLMQTFCNKAPPVSNILGIWKDPLQTLYCPERKNFVMIMNILCNIPMAAEMMLDFSSQIKRGIDFERCLLGRFLCSTHLPAGIMQTAEFFNKMPITIQEKQAEEQNIWQLSKACLSDTCSIFMSIFQAARARPNIKIKLLNWFGQCIHLNKGRNQLVHSLNSIPTQEAQFASDGFFMNLTNVLFHIADPLISPPFEKIFTIQLEFTNHKVMNESLLPGLNEETRLIPVTETNNAQLNFPDKYTVLTQLFYLLHKAFQLSFHVIYARFMELNQQLHRIQEVYEDLLNSGVSTTPEGEQLKKMMTNQMSQYMSLNSAMRQPEFMMKSFALVVSSCRLLVKIAKASDNPAESSRKISCIPEFVMDNIVDFLIFLRHFDDAFYETSGFSLDSLLEMVVIYMGSPDKLKNPHLRSKIATLLECLIPQRDEAASAQGGSLTFYIREHLFCDNGNWTHDMVIEALFSAFTTMELSTGQENVRFEEKFEYRRPMYACMRYFYNKPKFDNQIRRLERHALDNINDLEAPLCLKFLNLLINDATYLLDEALNYLGQLKIKELERINQGGKFTNQTEEGNFQHMVMLAKYHNSLATDTIEQLSRMSTLCPNILIHPILIDRIACTLNYFLDHLVGPKRTNLTVMNKEAYAFRPKQLVKIIAEIYVSLGDKPEFCMAVVNDGRSYSDKLLETASKLMGKVSALDLYTKFEDLANRLKVYAANQNEENENFEEAPEEFIDPIMSTVMRDPVILPSSGKIVDRKTIFRHLLSDPSDPFNRQPLSMSDVKPHIELKIKIFKWIEAQKHQ